MALPLTPRDLEVYLTEHQIDGELIYLDVPTPTVETAAEAVRVSPDQIVKSLLFMIGDRPVLVITSGLGRIDRRLLGRHFGVSRKKTSFADPDTVLSLTGYPVGAVPPLGHRQKLQVLVDPSVLAYETVYGGGGSETVLMRLPSQVIRDHNQAEVVLLQQD
jgi:Cys-tRNA(Pro)/Cys-tRNA(Cys) deacylase